MKTYNGFTDEELDRKAAEPGTVEIITSAWFGAWLMRRDLRRAEREEQEELDAYIKDRFRPYLDYRTHEIIIMDAETAEIMARIDMSFMYEQDFKDKINEARKEIAKKILNEGSSHD